MLRLLFRRYKHLSENTGKKRLLTGVPKVVDMAFVSPDKIMLDDYLQLDDSMLWTFFRVCGDSKDPILQRLGRGLLDRRLLKGLTVPAHEQARLADFASEARQIMEAHSLDPAWLFCDDTVADTGYKPYEPTDERPATQIFVEDAPGKPRALERVSKPVQALTEKISRLRYYYPVEVRDDVEKVAQNLWGGKA